jgi:signal peptidase
VPRHANGSASPRSLHALALVLAGILSLGGIAVATSIVVLHIGIRPVLTGSMRPTYGPGSLVVTRPVPVDELRPGMIVLFVPPGEHAVFAHRITSVSGSPSRPVITTKGDANKADDPWHAQLATTSVPEVVGTVPDVGRLLVGLHGRLQVVLVVLGGLCLGVSGTRRILRPTPPRAPVSP